MTEAIKSEKKNVFVKACRMQLKNKLERDWKDDLNCG